MKTTAKTLLPLATLCLLALTLTSCNNPNAIPPASHPDTAGFQPLFAPDLSNATFPDNVWTFENGILTASEDQNIWTNQSYDNFILDLEFKTAPGTNSGVVVHCQNTQDWIPASIEIQIADDYSEKWASQPATWHCGAIFGHLAPSKRMVNLPGQWNRYTITCQDNMVYVMLNGQQVTEMNLNKWTSATTNPDGSEIPSWLSVPLAEVPTYGRIGLQGKHADAPIYFRNIRIKELP